MNGTPPLAIHGILELLMKFRRKKQTQRPAHPRYNEMRSSSERLATDIDDVNGSSGIRRSILRIAVVSAIILIILIIAATTAFMTSQPQSTASIQAADTYAISSAQQQDIREKSDKFATGMMLFAYCSDEDVAMEGKNAAMSCLAEGSESYDNIADIPYEGGQLPADSIKVLVTDASMQSGSQSYAGTYVYTLSAAAIDTSQADENNPDGVLIDDGVEMRLTFSQATDGNTGETSYMIENVYIS